MFAYSAQAGAWLPQVRGTRAMLEIDRLRLATYNVWFDAFEAERRRFALFEILESEDLDVIALEEVTMPFLSALLEQPWVRASYEVTRTRLEPGIRYDVVVLSRQPVSRSLAHPLSSNMGRRLHLLELETQRGAIAIGAVHLESMKEMTPTRLLQIEECVPVLCESDSAVWLGDFNAAPGSPEHELMCERFKDAWQELSDGEPGYTRDTSKNAMLARVKDDRHQRIDRILFRSACFSPASIRLLGTSAIAGTDGQVFPSDHFGLVAELACTE